MGGPRCIVRLKRGMWKLLWRVARDIEHTSCDILKKLSWVSLGDTPTRSIPNKPYSHTSHTTWPLQEGTERIHRRNSRGQTREFPRESRHTLQRLQLPPRSRSAEGKHRLPRFRSSMCSAFLHRLPRPHTICRFRPIMARRTRPSERSQPKSVAAVLKNFSSQATAAEVRQAFHNSADENKAVTI